MNKNIDLNKLRLLLLKYYEAQTSPEEENLLFSIFSEIEDEDCPEDLTDDRRFFLSMNELLPCPTDKQVPDDLIVKINKEIAETPYIDSRSTRKKWKFPLAFASSVAAACLVLTFGLLSVYRSSRQTSPSVDNFAKTTSTSESTSMEAHNFSISNSSGTKPVAETKDPMQSTDLTESQRSNNISERRVLPKTDDGYTEITDPEEAREIIIEIGTLLAYNSKKTNEATIMVGNIVEEYKEITKSILK